MRHHRVSGAIAAIVILAGVLPSAAPAQTERLVVVMGDSYAAGEGNPDRAQRFWPGTYRIRNSARWTDRRCHRSSVSPAAIAAKALDDRDPRTTLRVVSVACSGALLEHMLSGGYEGIDRKKDDVPRLLPSQFDAVRSLIGNRPIDALVLDGGGNEARFSEFIARCLSPEPPHCWQKTHPIHRHVRDGLRRLTRTGGLYDQLATAVDKLNETNPISRVYVVEYADPTHNARGTFSGFGGLLAGLTAGEAEWAYDHILQPLNAALRRVAANKSTWTYVDGIQSAFKEHGYSAGAKRWFRTPVESLLTQGPLSVCTQNALTAANFVPGGALPGARCLKIDLGRSTGTMHPNADGVRAIAERLQAAMRPHLTPPPPTLGGTWAFAVGDYDGDRGRSDVYAIGRGPTGSGTTELHVLRGSTEYQTYRRQTPTALGATDPRWDFALGDYDADGGRPDLYGILRGPSGTNTTELHILRGSTDYRTFRRQTGTALGLTDTNWTFALGDYDADGGRPDLYGILRGPSGTNTTELHILRGSTDYRTFRRQTGTALGLTNANWTFALGDYDADGGRPDLYAIKRGPSGTGRTELHILRGSTDYRTFRRQTGTALHATDARWDFALGDYDADGGRPDLYAILRGPSDSGYTEVHILSGASDYQQFRRQTFTAHPQVPSG